VEPVAFSLGLQWAGIKVVAAVEVDDWLLQHISESFRRGGSCGTGIGANRAFFERHRGVEIVVGGPRAKAFPSALAAGERRTTHAIKVFTFSTQQFVLNHRSS